jgi:hypothetical protein
VVDLFVAKWLETRHAVWDNSHMTVTADDKKRVVLPSAKPGDSFDLQASAEGNFVLRRLEPTQSPVPRLVKPIPYKGGWLMPGEVDMDKLIEEIAQERQSRDENLLG